MTKRKLSEKEYWNMSYIETADPINKTVRRPLIIGRRDKAEMTVI
jgi:hypothetical protein